MSWSAEWQCESEWVVSACVVAVSGARAVHLLVSGHMRAERAGFRAAVRPAILTRGVLRGTVQSEKGARRTKDSRVGSPLVTFAPHNRETSPETPTFSSVAVRRCRSARMTNGGALGCATTAGLHKHTTDRRSVLECAAVCLCVACLCKPHRQVPVPSKRCAAA